MISLPPNFLRVFSDTVFDNVQRAALFTLGWCVGVFIYAPLALGRAAWDVTIFHVRRWTGREGK